MLIKIHSLFCLFITKKYCILLIGMVQSVYIIILYYIEKRERKMRKIFENANLDEKLIPSEEYVMFGDLKELKFPSPESKEGKSKIAGAEELLGKEFPILNASLYMRFLSDGNRSEYENLYFDRRTALNILTMAECIENKGRFSVKIFDLIWAILEESTWVIPAHNLSHDKVSNSNLPDCHKKPTWYIDLFSAETAALLAVAYYFLGNKLNAMAGPVFRDRLMYEFENRILKPFLAKDPMPWMGYGGTFVNNWNPWIISNILTATAVFVNDSDTRKAVVKKSAVCLDWFISSYPDDGGCNEGPGYWNEAGGTVFDAMEILDDMTGGRSGLFSNDFIKKMLDFIVKTHINDDEFITFGDAHANAGKFMHKKMIRRAGRRLENPKLEALGQNLSDKSEPIKKKIFNPFRTFKDLLDHNECTLEYKPSKFNALPDMQLCAMRETDFSDKGFYLWVKGGHNGESHNHNDVGSIGIYLDGKPLFIDIGIGTYTRFTFSDERYTLFPIRSYDHTLAVIGGKGQHEGKEYKSDFYNIDAENNTVSVGIKSAYENREIIRDYVRTASLNNGIITLNDRISLFQNEDILFNFYLFNKPEKISDSITDVGMNSVIECNLKLDTKIEEIAFSDTSFIQDWKTDKIYRLSFSAPYKTDNLDVCFKIYRK